MQHISAVCYVGDKAALALCADYAFFFIITVITIMGVTWPEGTQSLDGGVSVLADVTEDHPVCLRPGTSTRRHHHLCGRSL